MRDARGRELVFGIFHDRSERKRAEAALQESEERFRIKADGCPTIIWVTDSEGGIRFVNQKSREFFGVAYEQLEGGKWQPLLHTEDASEYIAAFMSAVGERRAFAAEARVRRADGEWRWIASYAEPRWSPSGGFLGYVGLSPDITERKRTGEALRASKEKFPQLAENIHQVFWMMNPAGSEILYVSPAYERIWGRSCEELYRDPMAWRRPIEPDDREQAHATFLKQLEGEEIDSE